MHRATYRSGVTPDPHPAPDAVFGDSPFRTGRTAGLAGSTLGAAPSVQASSILTKTRLYTINQLSHSPAELLPSSGSSGVSHSRASIEPKSGLAVATTEREVFVWPYGVQTTEASAKKLALPDGVGPSPFAVIVPAHSQSSGSDSGILFVGARTGRVVYWDSIDVLHAYSIRKDRHTIEATLPDVYDGDPVVELVEIADAGAFLVRLRSGKMSVIVPRDGRGRVGLKVSAFTFEAVGSNGASKGAASSGFFAGLRNALFSGPPRNIVAAQSGPGDGKGVGTVVVTTKSSVLFWSVDWLGQHCFTSECSPIDEIRSAVSAQDGDEVNICDSAVVQRDSTAMRLFLLVEQRSSDRQHFHLVDLTVRLPPSGTELAAKVGSTCQLRAGLELEAHARLVVPPGEKNTAVVVFANSLQLVCFEKKKVFQDFVKFRAQTGGILATVPEPGLGASRIGRGSTMQARTGGHVLAMLPNGGVVRVGFEHQTSDTNDFHRPLSALERFELAAFYGSSDSNPIDFLASAHLEYAASGVEKAGLAVSSQIVATCTRAIYRLRTQWNSKEVAQCHEVVARCVAGVENVRKLMWELVAKPSMRTRWHLLADLERIEMDKQLLMGSKDGLPITLPDNLDISPGIGFGEFVLPEVAQSLRRLADQVATSKGKIINPETWVAKAELADRIVLALETAFERRQSLAADYALDPAFFHDRMVVGGYEEAPEFWTSTVVMMSALKTQVESSRAVLLALGAGPNADEWPLETASQIRILGDNHAGLVSLACRLFIERIQWSQAQTSEQIRLDGDALLDQFQQSVRAGLIMPLSDLGLQRAGLGIAEQFREMRALSLFLLDQLVLAEEDVKMGQAMEERRRERKIESMLQPREGDNIDLGAAVANLDDLMGKVAKYYDSFKTDFSDAFFDAHLNTDRQHSLVTARFWQFENSRGVLAEYLHRPDNVKAGPIAWQFDAAAADYSNAAEQLFTAARTEKSLLGRYLNLSVAKLLSRDFGVDVNKISRFDYELEGYLRASHAQQLIYHGLENSVSQRLGQTHAIPRDRLVESALKMFEPSNAKSKPASIGLLRNAIVDVCDDQSLDLESTVDILTLLKDHANDDDDVMSDPSRFALALGIFQLALENDSCGYLPRLVLKRLILRDDWVGLAKRLLEIEPTSPTGGLDDVMTDLTPRTGFFGAVDFSHTVLYRTIFSCPGQAAAAMLDTITTIFSLSEDENGADSSKSGLLALDGAGCADDLKGKHSMSLAYDLGQEAELDNQSIRRLVNLNAEAAIKACLDSAEAALGRLDGDDGEVDMSEG